MRRALLVALIAASCTASSQPTGERPRGSPRTAAANSSASRAPAELDTSGWMLYTGGEPKVTFSAPRWPQADPRPGHLLLVDPEGAQVEIGAVVYDREITPADAAARWRAVADASDTIRKPYAQHDATLPVGPAALFEYRAKWSDGSWGDESLYLFVRGRSLYTMRFACRPERASICGPAFAQIRESLHWERS